MPGPNLMKTEPSSSIFDEIMNRLHPTIFWFVFFRFQRHGSRLHEHPDVGHRAVPRQVPRAQLLQGHPQVRRPLLLRKSLKQQQQQKLSYPTGFLNLPPQCLPLCTYIFDAILWHYLFNIGWKSCWVLE